MFSNLSESSISLATVTPSLVIRGAPYDLSSTTLRPFGPSVTLTVLARVLMPRSMRSRASPLNLTSLAAMSGTPLSVGLLSGLLFGGSTMEHAHDVGFAHDHQFFGVELDRSAGPLGEQHTVAGLHIHRRERAVFAAGAGAHRDDLAFDRLFLNRIRNEDAAGAFRLRFGATDQDAVLQQTQSHQVTPRPKCR